MAVLLDIQNKLVDDFLVVAPHRRFVAQGDMCLAHTGAAPESPQTSPSALLQASQTPSSSSLVSSPSSLSFTTESDEKEAFSSPTNSSSSSDNSNSEGRRVQAYLFSDVVLFVTVAGEWLHVVGHVDLQRYVRVTV